MARALAIGSVALIAVALGVFNGIATAAPVIGCLVLIAVTELLEQAP